MPHLPQSNPPVLENPSVRRLTGQVIVATFSRLLLNTARRFPYPFAPVLSRGMGVPLTAVTGLIAVNQVTSFLGIFFGPLADRYGYRFMMLAGMGMLVVGMLAGGLLPFYGVLLVSLFLAGLGKSIFDPALQAYVGERVPYQRRGLFIGVLETCWAGSTLLGIPLIAILIDRLGWRAPFFFLGGFGLLSMVVLGCLLGIGKRPMTKTAAQHKSIIETWKEILTFWKRIYREPAAFGALGFAFFVSIGNDNLFVVYGAWLEKSFGLSILAIGVGTIVIGLAELTGEVTTAALADRIGLPRSVAIGLALNTLSYLILPLFGHTLYASLLGLFLIFLSFEFTIVSALSLCTEVVPDARATMMSAFLAASGFGRVVGALMGGPVWLAGGILATGLVSAATGVIGLLVLLYGFRRWDRS